MTKLKKTAEGYQMGTTKIIKVSEGFKLEGDPVDLNVDKVDGKHADDLKHGIATDDETAIKVKIGSFNCPAGTGNYSVTGIGFKPRYVEFMTTWVIALLRLGTGWVDYNGNQGATVIASYIAGGTAYSSISSGKCIWLINQVGIDLLVGIYVSMDNDGFTVNFLTTNSIYKVNWKAVR